MDYPALQRLAPITVTSIGAFLAYSPQWLFYYIEPGPLRKGDAYIFNALILCHFVCYWRTCLTDPGRIPTDWHEPAKDTSSAQSSPSPSVVASSNRWCRKCEAFKPPRAHHCKNCKRCIMKMDHHCVWTANCVSHITIPHFIRFLAYMVAAMVYLEYFLFVRAAILWDKRRLPSYLGPSVLQLVHFFVLGVVNSFLLFVTFILLGRTIWSLAVNTWTIESWEIERHHTLLRRARTLGGLLDGPDGTKVRIEHQEFPWDVGIWTNICQGMGTWNVFAWFWPFASSPSIASGLAFAHNEIDDISKPWPPPDPDRLYKVQRKPLVGDGFTKSWDVDEFRKRQAEDSARYEDAEGEYVVRRKPFYERLEESYGQHQGRFADDDYPDETDDEDVNDAEMRGRRATRADEGEEGWRNEEGECLADFGVDEEADFYDEDDVPLGELVRRRKTQT